MKHLFLLVLAGVLAGVPLLKAAEDLRLNPRLDYSSDSQDGALITGKEMDRGAVAGKPNYILIYGEGCFNSKRQARRTVSLYEKYRGRVNFVVIDLDRERSPEQQQLLRKYYKGYIPHVVVLDKQEMPVYDKSGEVEENVIARTFDASLK